MKTQILIIHGGMTFKRRKDYISYLQNREISIDEKPSWKGDYLKNSLGSGFEIIKPRMPLQDNAKYEDWKIHFERHIPLLRNSLILIGSSLGGIFLARYLSENNFPKRILSTYLICPPFDNSLPGEDLVGGFRLRSDLSRLDSKNLCLMFSLDDEVVPVSQAEKYQKKLSKAKFIFYKSKNGHFRISEFPEIVKMIRADVANK